MDMLPLESAQFIVSKSEHVSIDIEAINNLAIKLHDTINFDNEYDIKKWKSDNVLHPQTMTPESINWIFLIDSLNFSFWPNENEEFTIDGEVGYWALCAAIKRAIHEQIPITDPNYYRKMTIEQGMHIFKTDNGNKIPMLEERISILNQNGTILKKHFDNSFVNCIKNCHGSAITLLKLIYEYFPSFRDEYVFKGHRVTFLKRAQILIADIWACFEGNGLGHFTDIDQLTMFADYRIPQVLHYFDVLKYSKELEDQLRENNLIENGHLFEIEIRGNSIQAIELIKEKLKELTPNGIMLPNSIQIDFYLWGYRRAHSVAVDQKSPFHRVRSIFY